MNNNKSTVVEDYHKPWKDEKARPEMVEVHLGVQWFTIDDQPNWHPTFNARVSRVKETKDLEGKPHTMYETVGSAEKLEELWYDEVWLKYVGKKMPRFKNNTGVCRPDTIYDQPIDLIEVLKKYSKDPRTKKFVCGTGKFWVESHNRHLQRGEEKQTDPNPKLEEITVMVMLFDSKSEASSWIKEVMSQVKGFTPKQLQKNKSQKVEPIYSDEEEPENPILIKLQEYVKTIAKNADHFCKLENKRQLQWAMWRFANIFYAARSAKRGYEDSMLYFFDSFEWSKGLSEKQIELIHLAGGSHNHLAEFGYVDKEFNRSYICDVDKLQALENSTLSEATLLSAKKQKTFEEHIKLHNLVYGKSELSNDLFLTYYSGYDMVDGYLVAENTEKFDPLFVYGFKEVPTEVMTQLNVVLLDEAILSVQNVGREEWEKDMVYYYERQFLNRSDIPKEFQKKMKKFNFGQWVMFASEWLKMAKETLNKKEDYQLILGHSPTINKVTKKSHPSYVQAAIKICEKTLTSKKSKQKDIEFAEKTLQRLK